MVAGVTCLSSYWFRYFDSKLMEDEMSVCWTCFLWCEIVMRFFGQCCGKDGVPRPVEPDGRKGRE